MKASTFGRPCRSCARALINARIRPCGVASYRPPPSPSPDVSEFRCLTARLGLKALSERWRTYEEALEEGGHEAEVRRHLLAQAALWRNVYVSTSDAQAEDELAALLLDTRRHMNHVRAMYNPDDFVVDPAMLNPWTDPAASDEEALRFTLETGSIYGTAERVREQVAALPEVGVQHLLCQMGFGAMAHERVMASMRLFGEEVVPALRD